MKNDCFFCQKKIDPTYKDIEILNKHISDRGKILSKSKTGLCQKHQKRIAKAIKRARHLSLLSYVSKA